MSFWFTFSISKTSLNKSSIIIPLTIRLVSNEYVLTWLTTNAFYSYGFDGFISESVFKWELTEGVLEPYYSKSKLT